jgi:hypothetical protein
MAEPIFFYEKNAGNEQAFKPLLYPDESGYDKFPSKMNFTKADHIESIIQSEKKWSDYVEELAKKFGYTLDLNSPYFIGFGGTSNAYSVQKDGKSYVLKFFWGRDNHDLYLQEINGYAMVNRTTLSKWIGKQYVSYYERNIGLIIMDYVGITLDRYASTDPSVKNIERVCIQLGELSDAMERERLYHNDLHSNNITISLVDGFPRVYIIDLEEVKPPKNNDYKKFRNTVKDFCKLMTK